MSEISELIFNEGAHKLTSPFGKREIIDTKSGTTSPFHNGADYGTFSKKLPQYAISSGEIISCGKDTAYGGAKYVWVKYPSLNVKMLHYHLDSIKVKKGQKVEKGTLLGYTGKTGKATGIHLHLGIRHLSGGDYIDPEKWSREEYPKLRNKETEKLYAKGNYKVDTAVLNVRTGPSTKYRKKLFIELTKDARNKIKKLSEGKAVNGYVKGLTFTASETKDSFGKTPSGWVCLDYCKKI